MPDDFLIARNPEADTSLPFLLRIPLGSNGVVVKAREMWPRTAKVYCHRAEGWPESPDILERTPTRTCTRRGAAIDLVLDRGRENRSQFVLTRARGREMIFWQTARTAKQARPNVALPTARAPGLEDVLEVIVDSHERYAWRFTHQQVTTTTAPLRAGDYGVELDGELVAAVERKSLADLVSTLVSGRLRYALAELDGLPRAAVVVEERYSRVFAVDWVRPAVVADGLAECQARFPRVPIMFCETRALAQEWTYRFLAASVRELGMDAGALAAFAALPAAPDAGAQPDLTLVKRPRPRSARETETGPSVAQVRAWARDNGYAVSDRGRLRPEIWAAFHTGGPE